MFPSRWFNLRYWATRYFPKLGLGTITIVVRPAPAGRRYTPRAETRTYTPDAETRTYTPAA